MDFCILVFRVKVAFLAITDKITDSRSKAAVCVRYIYCSGKCARLGAVRCVTRAPAREAGSADDSAA